jgi:hypothetical protein
MKEKSYLGTTFQIIKENTGNFFFKNNSMSWLEGSYLPTNLIIFVANCPNGDQLFSTL